MLAFSNDYYGIIFRATQSVELFCAYLAEYAEALKAEKKQTEPEKKPSIRAQLRADKEKTAQKKAAKTKNHELEV